MLPGEIFTEAVGAGVAAAGPEGVKFPGVSDDSVGFGTAVVVPVCGFPPGPGDLDGSVDTEPGPPGPPFCWSEAVVISAGLFGPSSSVGAVGF